MAILYANGTVACRHCRQLAYDSQQETLSTSPSSSAQFGYVETGSPSISLNGTAQGIVWVVTHGPDDVNSVNKGVLRAYDATNLGTLLYDSDQASGGRDTLGSVAHFGTPTIANGKVYVATQSNLIVYGLL